MKELAVYLMLILGGNDSPSADDVTKALSAVGIEPDQERLATLVSELQGKNVSDLMESGSEILAKFGSVQDNKAQITQKDQQDEQEENVVEEDQEIDLDDGMPSMFGDDNDGDY